MCNENDFKKVFIIRVYCLLSSSLHLRYESILYAYIFKTLKVANATATSCKIFKFDMTPFLVLNQHSMPDQKNQLQSDEQWAKAEWFLSSKEKVAGDIKFLMTK